MGSVLGRRIAGVEDIDIQANSAYRFPPKSGNYFASHFFMGGEKFDTPHPEGYLFGENMDLNFLGNRPVQFPYVTPAPHEPVKTLRSLVNIRKDSLRLVRYKDEGETPTEEDAKPKSLYGVEFTFDSDARVAITIYCQAFEEFSNGMAVYNPKSPAMVSETVHYKRGVSQQFSLPSFKISFSEWKEEDRKTGVRLVITHLITPPPRTEITPPPVTETTSTPVTTTTPPPVTETTLPPRTETTPPPVTKTTPPPVTEVTLPPVTEVTLPPVSHPHLTEVTPPPLNFDLDRGIFPMVIQAVVDEGDDLLGHAHVLLAAFERHVDGSFSVKPLKQKQIVDRVSYLLQEIYGIENKHNQETKPSDDENSDNSNECVVCLSDLRDTLILPCRHLCLCNSCADTLRYQANNCPICRLRALSPVSFSPVLAQSLDHDEHSSSDSVPPGFEPISLLEALNGLTATSPAVPSAPLYDEINYSGSLSGDSRQLSSPEHSGESSVPKGKVSKSPDSTLRSPSSPIQEEDEEKLSEMSDAQAHTLLSSSPAPTEDTGAEDAADSLSPEDDLSGSMESLITRSTSCSSQPLLRPISTLHMEDE
ncbi:putative E3 ubiquitin-protein ligase MGRN1 [Bagarius yarrelli]|uniref:E3 ubiquitin-protein ligase n=1 Tax=Bagarius yarrelli TaxID=175774 RepID=A0A556V8B2_BAGYA|nr:putative E3 ubiquitin-protein ligase MGRN1 [Bagarius yarrelli]